MKNWKIFIVGALLSSFIMAADETAEVKYGVVNMTLAIYNTDAAKDANEELKKNYGADEQAIKKLEEEIKGLQDKLKTDSAIMSEDEIEKLRLEGQGKVKERAMLVEKLKRVQDEARKQFVSQNRGLMNQAVKAVSDDMGMEAIFDATVIVYSPLAKDITPDVVKKFNELYKAKEE